MAESDIVRNEQLLKLIDEFREKVRSGMRDSENFIVFGRENWLRIAHRACHGARETAHLKCQRR